MTKVHRKCLVLLAVLILPVSKSHAQQQEALVATELSVPGEESRSKAAITVDDIGTVNTGSLMVGMPFRGFDGTVKWEEFDGSGVIGTMYGSNGREIGRFVGTRSGNHVSGEARFLDGRVMSWSWNED